MKRAIDYAIFPLLIVLGFVLAWVLVTMHVPNALATPIGVTVLTAIIFGLERSRTETQQHRPLDQPLFVEVAHFIFSFELGYGIALLACAGIERAVAGLVALPSWPSHWPVALQIVVALLVYEGTTYWQHRALHRYERLFRFHALHHAGTRLNFIRAVRFHAVDIGTASFVAYLPLVLLHAPDDLFTYLAILLSALGMLQHANIRMRTPRWLDALVCTPAVHRRHHSRSRAENDTNFSNSVMIFDHLFGTYGHPRSPVVEVIGIENDSVPRGFFAQVLSPFR
jgi:sterol desaturase/sphingolipid hydroxylase (fatty acid hydroxylase superfamily)